MGVFKLFGEPVKAPPGEPSNPIGSASEQPSQRAQKAGKPKPFVVGGNLTKEGTPAQTHEFKGETVTEPTDALSPMAALRNSLSGIARIENLTEEKIKEIIVSRAIARAEEESKAADKTAARAKGKMAGETEFENLITVSLPELRESLIYWTGTVEIGERVTLPMALKAIQTIEDGTKSKQDFAFNYTKKLYKGRISPDKQTLPPGRVAQELLNNPNLKDRFDELWMKVSNYDARAVASRETAGDMSELNVLFAQAIGIDSSDISPANGTGTNSEVSQAKLLANQAHNRGKSLQATLEQVLREIKLPDPATGMTTSALILLQSHKNDFAGPNAYVEYPSTDVATTTQLAQKYFNEPRRNGTFVLDRSNARPIKGAETPGEREYGSIGIPLSKILYQLKKNAEAITDTENEIESEPIAIVLNSVHDELVNELTETFTTALNRPLETDEIEKYIHRLVFKLGEDNALNDIYDEALVTYKNEVPTFKEKQKLAHENGMAEENAWETPDEFALLQRHFTAVLANRLGIQDTLAELGGRELKDIKLEFGGVERDPEVDALLRSEDTDRDLGAKRMKVEAFIQNLGKLGDITKQLCPDCSSEEREEMTLIAKAIYHYANEKRLERWDPTNTKADESGTTLKNYAAVFSTLSNRGLIEPLPASHLAPPQAETESSEEYTLRLRKYFVYQDGLRTKAHNEFLKQQQASIIADLRSLTQVLKSKDKLSNFLGSLGRILNKTGNALKGEILGLVEEIKAEPELFTNKTPSEKEQIDKPYQIYIGDKLMQPKQETIDTLESLHSRTESVQMALDKLEDELKVLIHRVQNQVEANPEALDTAITNWFNNYQSQVLEPLEKLRADKKLEEIITHTDENLRRSSAYLYNAYLNVVEGNRRTLNQYENEVRSKLPSQIQKAEIVGSELLKAKESIEALEDDLRVTNGALDEVVVENSRLGAEIGVLKSGLKGRVSDLNNIREQQESETVKIAAQIQSAEDIRTALEKQILDREEADKLKTTTIQELQARIERDNLDKKKLNAAIAERNLQLIELSSQIATLSTQDGGDKLNPAVNSIEGTYLQNQIASLETRLEELTIEKSKALLEFDIALHNNDTLAETIELIMHTIKADQKYADLANILSEALATREKGGTDNTGVN